MRNFEGVVPYRRGSCREQSGSFADLFIEHITVHERMEHEYLFERAVDLVRRDTDKKNDHQLEKIHTDLLNC